MIKNDIEIDKVKDIVPRSYREIASSLETSIHGSVTLVMFPHGRGSAVKSALVGKALKKIDLDMVETLVVLGRCFTEEAIELLKPYKTFYLIQSEFNWTDSSVSSIDGG